MAQTYSPLSNNFRYDDLVNSFSDEDLLQSDDGDVDIQEIVAEIGQRYDVSSRDEVFFTQATNTEGDACSALGNSIDQLNKHEKCLKKSCANCSKPRRVEYVSSLKKGPHISMPGQYSTKYVKEERKMKRMYDHHAIVKEIKSAVGSNVTMVLIHFTKHDGKIAVHEETKEFNLRVNELYIVDYVFPRYDPDTVVTRAESILTQRSDKFETYNIVTGNCEHFATWCVVGESKSSQVQSMRQKIADALSRLLGAGSKIAKGILRLLVVSSDEIASRLSKAVPELVLGGAASLYLIYCIVMTALHVQDYKNDQMCWSCLKGKVLDLWLTFGAFVLTSMITFLILHFAVPLMAPGVGMPLVILSILLAVAFQMSVPRLRKALTSPFSIDRVKVTNLANIRIGDVLSHRFYGVIEQTSIVSEVTTKKDKQTKGWIRLIHYGLSTSLATKIVEEDVEIDTDKSSIYVLDCKPLCTFPADIVVSRARSRIGETKWALFSNRSDHFSYWAKVQQYNNDILDEISNEENTKPTEKIEASLFIEKREIHNVEDIRIGEVVQSNVIGIIDDTGILSSVRYFDGKDGRKFEIDVYSYSFLRTVTRKKYTVDLNKDRLYVKVYNPAQCQTMEQRVQNARDMENKKGSWWTTEGFIEHCIELNSE
ncbi:Hypothetical predicted protein [Mytilus galloprovincialis]|uniref:LRAT domain-containing protein n=1 Tax=Mytilus galloprovincialis TaxID=29158 RepID=A0A8B6HDD5_MYTGA|nr:Hypothetical predicted protein [Mytilus galloprovincialis]